MGFQHHLVKRERERERERKYVIVFRIPHSNHQAPWYHSTATPLTASATTFSSPCSSPSFPTLQPAQPWLSYTSSWRQYTWENRSAQKMVAHSNRRCVCYNMLDYNRQSLTMLLYWFLRDRLTLSVDLMNLVCAWNCLQLWALVIFHCFLQCWLNTAVTLALVKGV